MVQYGAIFYESEVTVIVDNMNGSDRILLILLTNSDILVSKYIVTVEIEPWAPFKHALIASKRLKVARL